MVRSEPGKQCVDDVLARFNALIGDSHDGINSVSEAAA
jgi:hypothetical protein